MNRNGKSGTIFIFLIPLFIIIIAFIYDNALMTANDKLYKETSNAIIKEALSNNYNNIDEFIKSEYEKKKLETDQLKIYNDNEYLYVYNVHSFPAFFGVVLGKSNYRTEINIKAKVNENNEVVIEEANED